MRNLLSSLWLSPVLCALAACGVDKNGLQPRDGGNPGSGGRTDAGAHVDGLGSGGAGLATAGTAGTAGRNGGGTGGGVSATGGGAGGGATGGTGTGGGAGVSGTGGAAALGGSGMGGGAATGGAGTGGTSAGGAGTGGAATGGASTGGMGTGGAATGGVGTGGAGSGGAASGGAGTGGAASGGAGTGGAATGGAGTGGAATGGAGTGSFNTIFATSRQFTLDELAAKGVGADVAATVLSGADAACAEAVAGPGSLAPPGKYVAWLSSATAHARDRLQAAAGGVMPRGWVRIDGRPFLDEIPAATDQPYVIPAILYPVNFDEKGTRTFNWARTATDTRGLFTPNNSCSNWTNRSSAAANAAGSGLPYSGGSSWTTGYASFCSDSRSVYCMQVDHFNAIPPQQPPANAKRVFIAEPFSPATGLAGADARCAANATAAGLTGLFRALLAPTGASAASRFHPDSVRPFVRTDGVLVAPVDIDLFMGGPVIYAPIVVNASGQHDDGYVFAGSSIVPAPAAENCDNWTTASAGRRSNVIWAALSGLRIFDATGQLNPCNEPTRIFCVED